MARRVYAITHYVSVNDDEARELIHLANKRAANFGGETADLIGGPIVDERTALNMVAETSEFMDDLVPNIERLDIELVEGEAGAPLSPPLAERHRMALALEQAALLLRVGVTTAEIKRRVNIPRALIENLRERDRILHREDPWSL